MKTEVIAVDPQRPDSDIVARAAALIRAGELVAFPTETVYGLGADALNGAAAAKIFAAKERPAYDPIIVHIADPRELETLTAAQPEITAALTAAFWPGPLTLILPRAAIVPDVITAAGPTVAVRCPAHPVAQALLRAAGTPIGAPSANRFSHTSPTTAQHVWDDLHGRIPLILDGGSTNVGVESTVLDLTTTPPTLLRPGGVPLEALQLVIGPVAQKSREVVTPSAEKAIASPGMLERHYAPHATLHLFTGRDSDIHKALHHAIAVATAADKVPALLLAHEDTTHFAAYPLPQVTVGSLHDLETVAHNLFNALRHLDTADTELIFARDFPAEGLGLAIRDRLRRAAEVIVEAK